MNDDLVESVAVAIERTMFAPHEFPLEPELHGKYRRTATKAIETALKEIRLHAGAGPHGSAIAAWIDGWIGKVERGDDAAT